MLRNDEVFYKICFDSLLEGVCITNSKGYIVFNNSPLEEIFGYNKGELINKNIDILIPEEFRQVHHNHFTSYFKLPKKYKKGKGREFAGLHKKGNILQLEIGLNYFKYKGKTFAKALITDISSRKKNEIKIKELNISLEHEVEKQTKELIDTVNKLKTSNRRLKEEFQKKIIAENKAKEAFKKEKELNLLQTKFLSLVSHEFKTPLSGILSSTGLISKYNKNLFNKNIENHTQTIKKLVYQLNSVLDDFLFLEKTETKELNYHFSKYHFCDFVQEIIKSSKSVLKEGQKIEFTPCKKDIEVYQDKKIVEIIIRNILYNAIKYSLDNTKIRIIVTTNKYITVIIEDKGIGIPKEAQKHIFDRFFRAKNALCFQGTGIGLNIVKHHLNELNGSIRIESIENKGTTAIIKLPIIVKEKHEPTYT